MHTARALCVVRGVTYIHTYIHTADCVSYVAWSLDDKWLLSGANDLAVNLWDAASGLLLRQFVRHSEPVTAIAWSPCLLFLEHRAQSIEHAASSKQQAACCMLHAACCITAHGT